MARHSKLLYRRRQYWYFKHKNQAGQWVERTTHSTDYREALGIRTAFLRELEDGRLPNDRSQWTLKQAAAEWLTARKFRVAHGTYLSEGTITRNLMRMLGQEIPLIKLATIQTLHRYETLRLEKGISPKTVNNELVVFAGILRDANLWHRVAPDYKQLKVPHSYITRAAEAGVPLPVIQAQVGHMSVQMVEHYTHICQAAIHRAAAQIEEHSVDLLSKLGFSQHSETGAVTTKMTQ